MLAMRSGVPKHTVESSRFQSGGTGVRADKEKCGLPRTRIMRPNSGGAQCRTTFHAAFW
jgi:hypothetical protein